MVRRIGVRAYCLGLGVDPVTLAVDLPTVVVFDSEAFDEFQRVTDVNDNALRPYLVGGEPSRRGAGICVTEMCCCCSR